MKELFTKKTSLIIIVIIVLLITSLTSYYFFQYQRAKKNPEKSAHEEIMRTTEKIQHFIDLPKDEIPRMFTVSNREKLQNQPFFERARDGDQVLIYVTTNKAILYRPSDNRVIEVAPFSVQ